MNGTWKNWILGIAATLFVLSTIAGYKTNIDIAETLGGLKVSITSLEQSISKLDTQLSKDIERLRERVKKLEEE